MVLRCKTIFQKLRPERCCSLQLLPSVFPLHPFPYSFLFHFLQLLGFPPRISFAQIRRYIFTFLYPFLSYTKGSYIRCSFTICFLQLRDYSGNLSKSGHKDIPFFFTTAHCPIVSISHGTVMHCTMMFSLTMNGIYESGTMTL